MLSKLFGSKGGDSINDVTLRLLGYLIDSPSSIPR